MVNTPIPTSLKSEAKKAAKILRAFTIPSTNVGPDKLIPASLVANAQGLCILTVAKVGFLITARGGSGIVIAKDRDGNWSAPSAIGIAGLGGGLEIGAEVTDFIIILNKRAAVDAFSKGGNLTLGGNFTIAAGPVGCNLEADVSLRSTAAIYTYSHTKGLFAGISIEGSGLIERKDANKNFYGRPIRAFEILNGEVEPPPECAELYDVLEGHDKMFKKAALAYAKRQAVSEARKTTVGGAAGMIMARMRSFRSSRRPGGESSVSSGQSSRDSVGSEGGSSNNWYNQTRHASIDSSDSDNECGAAAAPYNACVPRSKSSTVYGFGQKGSHLDVRSKSSDNVQEDSKQSRNMTKHVRTRDKSRMSKSSTYLGSEGQTLATVGVQKPQWPKRPPPPKTLKLAVDSPWDKKPMARALWDYEGQMPCDLTFKEGDQIEIMTRTGRQDDWWEGKLNGRLGIFPANYVEVMSMC